MPKFLFFNRAPLLKGDDITSNDNSRSIATLEIRDYLNQDTFFRHKLRSIVDANPGMEIVIPDSRLSRDFIYTPVGKKIQNQGPLVKANLMGKNAGCNASYRLLPVQAPLVHTTLPVFDVTQGLMDNCVFISSVRAIARRYPQWIDHIITENHAGGVQIHFFSPDTHQPIQYVLDKTVITQDTFLHHIAKLFVSRQSISNEFQWVQLIEKALAINYLLFSGSKVAFFQRHGPDYQSSVSSIPVQRETLYTPSYNDIVKAAGSGTFEALLGCSTDTIFPNQDEEQVFSLKDILMQGELVLAAFNTNARKSGLVIPMHAYEIVNFARKGDRQVVMLSNPWGRNSTRFNSAELHEYSLLIQEPRYVQTMLDDPGIVLIEMNDFMQMVDFCTYTQGACRMQSSPMPSAPRTPG